MNVLVRRIRRVNVSLDCCTKSLLSRYFSCTSWRLCDRITSITLRPYQEECIQVCLRRFEDGVKSQVVSLPVGSGKTVIFSHMIAKLPPLNSNANKVLVLAHREELLDQAFRHLCTVLPDKCVDIEQGRRHASPAADIIVASVPTLGRKINKRIERLNPDEFKLIVIDEAHHSSAESYLRVLAYFNALSKDEHLEVKNRNGKRSDIYVWGCTGTVQRSDGIGLQCVYDCMSYSKSLQELWTENWLVPIKAYSINTNTDLSGVKRNVYDFDATSLSNRINVPDRNGAIVKTWLSRRDEFKSTLVFAADRRHASDLTAMFRSKNVDTYLVDGTTPSDHRAELVSNFKEQRFPVMINCGVFTEGTDIPNIDCVILARPTRSCVLFQQMIGRGLRLFPDKLHCSIFDCFDNVVGCDLVTLPSLIGLPPKFNCQGLDLATVSDKMQQLIKENAECLKATSITEAEKLKQSNFCLDFLVTTIDGSEPQVSDITHMFHEQDGRKTPISAWRRYFLELQKESIWGISLYSRNKILVLKNESEKFDIFVKVHTASSKNLTIIARHNSALSVKNYYHIVTTASAISALRCGITLAERIVGRNKMVTLDRYAAWRLAPATDAQRQLIERLSLPTSGKPMTKGFATDLLNKRILRRSAAILRKLLRMKKDMADNSDGDNRLCMSTSTYEPTSNRLHWH